MIHGARQGSWVWADVVPRLNEAGHSCHAVDLSGSAPDIADRANVTFRDQVEYLEDLIAEIGEPVVVVAHSCGGLAASQIAENLPDRVTGIVYVAGIMLPEAAAIETFFHDGEPDAAARAAARLTPQSNAARDASPHLTADRFGSVPRIYIEALKDRSVVPFVQRRMQELVPGAEVRSIDTGHAPMVADAALLSEMLVEAVSDLDAG